MRKPLQEPVDLHGLVSSAAAAGVLGCWGWGLLLLLGAAGWPHRRPAGRHLRPAQPTCPANSGMATTFLLGLAALQDNGD